MSALRPQAAARGTLTLPSGVEIASYATYLEAQKAVDHLSDEGFPVQHTAIVGTDLRSVERVTGRLTYARVALAGAASGVWFGAFVGLLLISNVGATKAIAFTTPTVWPGMIVTDGGAFLFPLTYVLGDVLAEVYGLRKARRAILIGFVLAAIAALTFWLAFSSVPVREDDLSPRALAAAARSLAVFTFFAILATLVITAFDVPSGH